MSTACLPIVLATRLTRATGDCLRLRPPDFFAEDFFAEDLRAVDLRADDFLADFREEDFLAPDFLVADFRDADFLVDFFADDRLVADLFVADLRRLDFFARDDFFFIAIELAPWEEGVPHSLARFARIRARLTGGGPGLEARAREARLSVFRRPSPGRRSRPHIVHPSRGAAASRTWRCR